METLLTLAHLCTTEFQMPQAAAALRRLAMERLYHLPAQNWLVEVLVDPHQALAESRNPFFPQLPECSWKMLVKPQRRLAAAL